MNRIELHARIAQLSELRYTPAGIPAVNLVLEHESEQQEAGAPRQVRLSMKAVAFGTLAERSSRLPLGQPLHLAGFLASARTSKAIVFHIQELNSL